MRTTVTLISIFAVISAFAQIESPDSIKSRLLNDSIMERHLDEVTVKGEKPLVKGRDGIMVVDLPTIVKDKAVTNILEALSYLPGVIDNNGMIGLAGASEVTIILNGQLTDMPVGNLYQLLYSTPIDRLKNVEVMYTAPMEYHVNGAVINIVWKPPKPLDGLQGEARIGYNQTRYASFGTGLSATYAVKGWSFDLNYGLSRSKTWNNELSQSNHLYDGTRTLIEDDMRRTSSNLSNLMYASAGYKLSDKSDIKLTYNGQITSDIKAKSLTTGTLGDYINNVDYPSPIGYHNIALRYTSPFGMTIGGDYTRYSENRTQHLSKLPAYAETVLATNRQRINRYHAYIDQSHGIGDWQISYGVEYQHSDDRSSQRYELPQQAGFKGTTKEDVANAYAGIRHTFPFGLSFNASAKGEYYHNTYSHNWNFIPQLGATYYKTTESIFQLNFSSRRVYPSYWELRGGTSYLNDYSEILGNPMLQPSLNYEGQLSYILKQKYVATLYMQYGDKTTVQLPYQSPEERKLIYQTINMDYKRTIGLNLNIPFDIGPVWSAQTTANLFHQREKATHFHDISFDNKKWVFYGALNNTIRFTPDFPIALTVDFSYISPSLQGIADLSGLWRIDAGVKWRFGRKRCCELDLKANDIFNRWSPTMTIDHAGQDYSMKVCDMTRSLKLSFIWRFNGFKPKSTDIDTSRFGTGK